MKVNLIQCDKCGVFHNFTKKDHKKRCKKI